MSKTEAGMIENAHTARVLQDDELDAVSGGLNSDGKIGFGERAYGIVITKATDAS